MKYFGIVLWGAGCLMISLTSCRKKELTSTQLYSKGKFSIELTEVLDSRCPEGATCFWEGEVLAGLKVTDDGTVHQIYLGGEHADTTLGGKKIKMLKVEPYPQDGEQLSLEDYTVYLEVN